MSRILIENATLVNEGQIYKSDMLIDNGLISKISKKISAEAALNARRIDATGLHLIPGLIDDQVHFREPGLTHKGDIQSESRAAVAGGITSYMEMPNTVPNALTQKILEEKYQRAAEVSAANYSFFMGASNDNLPEVIKTDPRRVCGIKIFMGSSTGNMLVDKEKTLEGIFRDSPTLIATHCEDEQIIRRNTEIFKARYGEDVPVENHPLIRSAEACYRSSSKAIDLASRFGARLHVLHISTAREVELFEPGRPLKEKRITAEACTHHIWFTDEDYGKKGSLIKWNPAVKSLHDRDVIRAGVIADRIDVLATDHAPHTLQEKMQTYFKAPSGGPLVQHGLLALLELVRQDVFSLEKIVEKTSHSVATLFQVANRGYLREGYAADLVLVNLNDSTVVTKNDLLYKCGWSPFEGEVFHSSVKFTFVNGEIAYDSNGVNSSIRGKRLEFER